MAIVEGKAGESPGRKVWGLCRMPFWQSGGGSSNSSTQSQAHKYNHSAGNSGRGHGYMEGSSAQQRQGQSGVSSVARSLFPTRRRLRLDPATKLYFPYEPGKQVRSAIRIKNTSKSHVGFKFQTTAPKSCFMRPPGGILAPGESILATVFKFVEHPENDEKQLNQKCKVKFKIVSLKVNGPMEYVPELFDEQKDQVSVEQILGVVFLDVDRPSSVSSCPSLCLSEHLHELYRWRLFPCVLNNRHCVIKQMDKLKRQLAEADTALEARKKPPEDTGPRIVGEGLVIDEWKERRERYLAQHPVEVVDSL